jgi:hypothetical protein
MNSASLGSDSSILSKASLEETTVVGRLAFQGRVFRVHFDEGAPPVRGATTVAGHALSTSAEPNRVP